MPSSSAKAEYRAMANITSKVVWIRILLHFFNVSTRPALLRCDNQVALHIAVDPVFYECRKHIEVNYHFVRGQLLPGTLGLAIRAPQGRLHTSSPKPWDNNSSNIF